MLRSVLDGHLPLKKIQAACLVNVRSTLVQYAGYNRKPFKMNAAREIKPFEMPHLYKQFSSNAEFASTTVGIDR